MKINKNVLAIFGILMLIGFVIAGDIAITKYNDVVLTTERKDYLTELGMTEYIVVEGCINIIRRNEYDNSTDVGTLICSGKTFKTQAEAEVWAKDFLEKYADEGIANEKPDIDLSEVNRIVDNEMGVGL